MFLKKNSMNIPVLLCLTYLILLPFNISICGQFYLHDCVAPLFLFAFAKWREVFSSVSRMKLYYLLIFLAMASFSTLINLQKPGNLYELLVFGYVIFIFLFFSVTKIPSKILLCYGLFVLLCMLGYDAYQFCIGVGDIYKVYKDTALDFISKRYFFTFNHPNLTGSFYSLPILCLLLGSKEFISNMNLKRAVMGLGLILILCIPLCMTVSKHMLISMFIIAAAASFYPAVKTSAMFRILMFSSLLMCAVIFYATVLYPVFPLDRAFPFINVKTCGMYMIHQAIYFKIIFLNVSSFFMGVGMSGIVENYPLLANHDLILSVLQQYKQENLVEVFSRYMDAHNEYLNIGALFGVPAAIFMYLFWFKVSGAGNSKCVFEKRIILFYVAAIFIVSLWDDILSKRWIWISLGILLSQMYNNPDEEDERKIEAQSS
jgi:hypothetical protein